MHSPPPPPPPSSASPPVNRFVRRQHQHGDSQSPGMSPLDATQRPPPPPGEPPSGGGARNPRASLGRSPDDAFGFFGHDTAPKPPPPSSLVLQSVEAESSPQGNSPSAAAGGRKLKALRRAGSFSKLTSVPEKLQQWFDGCYSTRYCASSSLPISAVSANPSQIHFMQNESPSSTASSPSATSVDAKVQAASFELHKTMATFALRHCFDSPLFDVPDGGNTPASLHQLSTTFTNGGGGVDHSTKKVFDNWCETFEECLTHLVSNVLQITDDEFAATLELDKKEEAAGSAGGSSDGASANLFGVGSNISPIHDLRAAIAPLACSLEHSQRGHTHIAGPAGGGGGRNSPTPVGNSPSAQALSRPGSGQKQTLDLSGMDILTKAAASLAEFSSSGEKEHFFRWNDAIEFPAFVAAMRGVRAALARLVTATEGAIVAGLSPALVTQFQSLVNTGANAVAAVAHEKAIADPLTRNVAHHALKDVTRTLFAEGYSPSHPSSSSTDGTAAAYAYFFMTPLIHFIRDQSVGARQQFRRRAALVPLLALWCPMGMDEDIWPVIQPLLSASGATIPNSTSTFKIALEKKALKDLTLFRIRLTAAGKSAALAAASEVLSGGSSPAVLSAPQYLLRPSAAAAGSVAVAIGKAADAPNAAESAARPSSGGLEATSHLESDWVRFVSVFAESLDSAAFDRFVAYMYAVVLPTVILKDTRELVKLGAAAATPASPADPSQVAFCASISSPLSNSSSSPLIQGSIQAAARTVKRIFWMAFQQLDMFKKEKVPTSVVLELISATISEISENGGLVASIHQQHLPQSRHIPAELLKELSLIERRSAANLCTYLKFTERDRSKLLVRLRNERNAAVRDAASQGKLAVVGSGTPSSEGGFSTPARRQTDPLGNSVMVTPSPAASPQMESSLSPSRVSDLSVDDPNNGESGMVSLYQFVHIIKDLVFDPLYSAAHPLPNGASPSIISTPANLATFAEVAAAEGRHLYWAELASFIEIMIVVGNQSRFRQMLRRSAK